MRHLVFLLVLVCSTAYGFGKKQPVPEPAPSPVVTPSPVVSVTPLPVTSPSPAPTQKVFVTLGKDVGPSVDIAFANKALSYMNSAYSSGCLEMSIEQHKFL